MRPQLPPRRARRPFSTWGGVTETEGDAAAAAALARALELEAGAAQAYTHGFHPYAGRMPPSLARACVQAWSRPGDRVLDPFCGSGTVLIEAYAARRRALGFDASAFAVQLARVRTRVLDAAGRRRLAERGAALAAASFERVKHKVKPTLPPWSQAERTRYAPHVLLELLGLRELVGAEGDDDVALALRMCLSSLLDKLVRGAPRDPDGGHAESRVARGMASRLFGDRAHELATGLAGLAEAAGDIAPPRVRLGDARRIDDVAAGAVTLVLTSPPYAGVYDYGGHHEASFRWLELGDEALRRAQVGTRDVGTGTHAQRWRADRRGFVGEMARTLAPGGHAVLVVGDGVVGDRPEDARADYEADARAAGLEVLASASQARPIPDRRLAAIYGRAPRREHVLLWRKA